MAIGLSEQYHYAASSWLEAERTARISLALSANCSIKGEQDFIRNLDMMNLSVETNVLLNNIKTIARGYNSDFTQRWVIVSVDKSGITIPDD